MVKHKYLLDGINKYGIFLIQTPDYGTGDLDWKIQHR